MGTTRDWPNFILAAAIVGILFFLLTLIFIPLGQIVSQELDSAPSRLTAYSWNLGASCRTISMQAVSIQHTGQSSVLFFAMGAGFLLLETQTVSRLALFFGTTWQVNGVAIGSVLTALTLANLVIEEQGSRLSRWWILVCLLVALISLYFVPFHRIPGSIAAVGSVAAVLYAIPLFFAGLLFAREFRCAESPSAALAANMLGAVAGGLMENLSLVVGLRALLLIAALFYLVAGIGLRTATVVQPRTAWG